MKRSFQSKLLSVSLGLMLLALTAMGLVSSPAAEALGPNAMRGGFNANSLPGNDDGSTGAIPLGFTANFFGNSYTSVYINNNGNLTFVSPQGTYTPYNLTTTGSKIVAPFFADVDTRTGSVVTYGDGSVDGHRALGANWPGVGCYSTNTTVLNYFQALLIDRSDTGAGNFDIEFNYDQIKWETGAASGGNSSCRGGFSARVGYSNGSGLPGTFYELPGSGNPGAFLDTTVTGLIHNSLNSGQLGRYVFNVRNGTPVQSDLALSMTATPNQPMVGNPLTYNLTVSNLGPEPATGVILTDTLPAGIPFAVSMPSSPNCDLSASPTVSCNLGSIAVNGSASASIVVTPTTQGTIVSTAGVRANQPDPNLSNNTASVSTTVIGATSTTLSASPAIGTYGSTTALSAALTAGGSPVSGRLISFALGGATVGSATTDGNGIATLNGTSLSGLNAGSYPGAVSASFAGDVTYAASSATAALTVTRAPLTGSITAANKVYDGTTAATITGRFLNGVIGADQVSYVGGTATFATKEVGNLKLVTATGLSLSGADAGNYTVNSTATTTADITARPLTVSATGVSKVYDGNTSATVTLSDNRVSGDVLTDSYTGAAFADKNVGVGKTVSVSGVSISGADAGNYTVNSAATTTANITPAPLTVTADNKTKIQGQPDPTLTVSYTGFVNSERLETSGVTGAPAFVHTNMNDSPIGVYSIAVTSGTLHAQNYSFSFVNGSLIIDYLTITGTISPNPNDKGWNNTNATVTFTCADGSVNGVPLIGIASCPGPVNLAGEGAGQVVNGTVVDKAGNEVSTSLSVNIDKTPPSAALSVTVGTPGTNGWYTSDVTVSTTGSDTISGPVVCTGNQTQTAETAGTAFDGSCTNDAGLTTSAAPLTVKLDKTPPSAALSVTAGTAGTNGWYTSDVTVGTTGSDSISSPVFCTANQTQTADTAGTAFNGSCTNHAGLTTSATPLTVKLDKTAPTTNVNFSVMAGASGIYLPVVKVTLAATDTVSGLGPTYYKLEGGLTRSWTPYTRTFMVNADIVTPTIVSFYSVDNAGNVEQTTRETVNRSKGFALLSAAASGSAQGTIVKGYLWGASGQIYNVSLSSTSGNCIGPSIPLGNPISVTTSPTGTVSFLQSYPQATWVNERDGISATVADPDNARATFSACRLATTRNVTWIDAATLPLDGSASQYLLNYQPKWFKIPASPGQRTQIQLTYKPGSAIILYKGLPG
ncbi:MAG: DUF11 domain-containing protein, partial [Chloroflexi bacterium]|nr:DUF11 domain-containing protein [Chloroflexota bacterium]